MLQTKEEGNQHLVNVYYTPVPTTTCEVKHYYYLYLQMCEQKLKEFITLRLLCNKDWHSELLLSFHFGNRY